MLEIPYTVFDGIGVQKLFAHVFFVIHERLTLRLVRAFALFQGATFPAVIMGFAALAGAKPPAGRIRRGVGRAFGRRATASAECQTCEKEGKNGEDSHNPNLRQLLSADKTNALGYEKNCLRLSVPV